MLHSRQFVLSNVEMLNLSMSELRKTLSMPLCGAAVIPLSTLSRLEPEVLQSSESFAVNQDQATHVVVVADYLEF